MEIIKVKYKFEYSDFIFYPGEILYPGLIDGAIVMFTEDKQKFVPLVNIDLKRVTVQHDHDSENDS